MPFNPSSGMFAPMKNASIFLVGLFVAGCSGTCHNTPHQTLPSPHGRFSAVLFSRDCGATTGFSSQVSVTGIGDTQNGGGNAFVADDNHGLAAAASWGGPWTELRWLSAGRLLVRYDARARVFKKEERVSGVSISYEQVPR